jgi:hypothetical protein
MKSPILIRNRAARLLMLGGAFALAFAFAPAERKALADDSDHVTVTGCVLRGDNGGYLLTGTSPLTGSESDWRATSSGAVAPVLYLLDDLKKDDADSAMFAGRRVEIEGKLKGDLKPGEMKIDRDEDQVKLEVKADGKTIKTKLPVDTFDQPYGSAVGTSGAPDHDRKFNVVVRKLEVKKAHIVEGSCTR